MMDSSQWPLMKPGIELPNPAKRMVYLCFTIQKLIWYTSGLLLKGYTSLTDMAGKCPRCRTLVAITPRSQNPWVETKCSSLMPTLTLFIRDTPVDLIRKDFMTSGAVEQRPSLLLIK